MIEGPDGKPISAADALEAAAERKRVADEIADACLLAGKPLPKT
jgi:hypothetical protein